MGTSETQVALITGCSSGIGRALVGAFVEVGWDVVATARRPESIEDLADERVSCLALDVTEVASIQSAVAQAVAVRGGIHVLVNNAGYGLIGPVAELDSEDLRRQLETNVVGAVEMIRAVMPHMAARRRGCLVNIGSVSSLLATPFGGAYSASKAALHLLSDALRPEVAPFGISVMVVRAGAVATSFPDAAGRGLDRYRDPASLYRDHADGMVERAGMSRNMAMAADEFARKVVRSAISPNPPAVLKIGGGARLVPMLSRLPKKLLARILGRKFGLR